MDETKEKALGLYYKLHRCLEKAIEDKDKLGCHVNSIVTALAKSIDSGHEWYSTSTDVWCDYFLKMATPETDCDK